MKVLDEKISGDKRNAIALYNFTRNHRLAENLTENQALTNLELGLLEIVNKRRNHLGNALMVTDNYFLTSYHIVKRREVESIIVKNYRNKIFKVSEVCEKNEEEDIALLKLDYFGKSKPRIYKISKKLDYSWGPKINLKTIRNNEVKNNSGFLIQSGISMITGLEREEEYKYNQILYKTDRCTLEGDSGGIIVDLKGNLIGFHNAGNMNNINLGSKISSGIDLIKEHANKLRY